jgi:outer membrane protein OmpA-like peptidoglycan-associated protein
MAMHLRISRTLIALLMLLATLPLLAQTQSNAPSSSGGETTPAKVEVFAGYSWMTLNDTVSGTRNGFPLTIKLKDARNGFTVAPTVFFNRWIGLSLDGGGHWGDNYTAAELMIGPEVRFPMEHIQPFIHALAGWTRFAPINFEEQNTFGIIAGGGIDVKVARHLNIRLAEADYIRGNPNWPGNGDGARLSAGLVFLGGVGQEIPPAASCSVDHNEVWAGEPVKASVRTTGFDPKHTLKYEWTTNGGKIEGQGDTVNINTTGVAEGQSYNVSVHVTDPKNGKKVAGCQATFATKKRQPPQISCSANPSTVTQGDPVTIHSDASSPQGGNLSVAVQSSCGASGQGNDVQVNTANLQPGACNVTCTVTDDHQLTAQSTTSFTVNPKKVCPPPTTPAEITLRSVYFATAIPTAQHPDRGLIASQQETLNSIATNFKQYMAAVQQANQGSPGCAGANLPEPKLYLQGFADPRGGDEYNQKLSERRVAIVQRYLEAQGIPSGVFVTQAYGKSKQLSAAEVKAELDKNPELNQLTPKERARILKNMRVIQLAANRRVDIGLNAPDQSTVREYPFRAADWLTLIGGREKPPAKKPGATKKPSTKKPSTKGGATKGGTKKK